jgi:UPF0176 protein
MDSVPQYTIAALYRIFPLADPAALRDQLLARFLPTDLCGTLLVTPEGINGTLAGSELTIHALLTMLEVKAGLDRATVKLSQADDKPFGRLKFLLRQEVIPFRNATVDPSQPGTYVEPQQWNALVSDPEVLVIDTRNGYETALGTFHGAVDPHLETFSDFAAWVREHLDPTTTPKVAMYCTGGIRCEKASAFMLQEGFREVFHLKGGILRYLEDIPADQSLWQGDCFVFDRRTSVDHTDFKPASGPSEA